MSEIDVTETEQTPYLGCSNDVFAESFESKLDPMFRSDVKIPPEGRRSWLLWSSSF